MTDNKVFKQKAVFIEYKVEHRGEKQDKYITLVYTRPDGDDPSAILRPGSFENQLDTDTKKRLLGLKANDEFCVTKEKVGNFWRLVSVSDVSDAPVRSPSNNNFKTEKFGGGAIKAYNSAGRTEGQTRGMVTKAAVDLCIAQGIYNMDAIKETAQTLMRLSYQLELEDNRGDFKATATTQSLNLNQRAASNEPVTVAPLDLESIEL